MMVEKSTGPVTPTDPGTWHDLTWRLVGPFRAGRVIAVAGHPTDQATFYFGSTGGGVWKTTDAGQSWNNISDGYFKRASVGGIAVSPSDPNVIYVATGEATIRGNVSHGDGVYKSTDGGQTWTNVGLAETRNIGRVRVDPHNPDLVYVAALGHAHGPNKERGIYRSKDGGQNWEQVLFRGEKTGAIDLSIDAHNPRVIYAAFWQTIRTPYSLESGGEECGIWRTIDGGDSWEDITRNPGLPKGVLGKIGISASPAAAGVVYALVEAEDGAVFRSADRGQTWQRMSEDKNLRERPWYFNHIIADPKTPDTVWVLSFYTWKSTDGGKTFVQMPTSHADNHDLWVDPNNPQRMIIGHDGGAAVSLNGAAGWSSISNQPTVEFYHVTTDTQTPYRIYGAQQDNTTISVPSRSNYAAITQAEWTEVGGGESGYIAVRPDDPNIIFAGSYGGVITRLDQRTGQRRAINVWPEAMSGHGAKDVKYRFQWTYPIILSPHDQETLYITSNIVHRSRDQGNTWENVSPDLTRNDATKMEPSGGVVTRDNTGAEYYCTIFAFDESKVQQGVLWAGSDDGLVHVSRDGGASWQNVTPPDLPEWALISIIEPSPHDAGAAYVAATRYKSDDFAPYLYKTNDFGATWTKIVNGIPADDFTRVVREDPERRGLLYAGTETGLYVSFDDGANWQRFQSNLPVVPIHDLVIKESDMILATHGRSFWVLDDLTPIRMAKDNSNANATLFAPRQTVRYMTMRGFGGGVGTGNNYQGAAASLVTYRMVPDSNGGQTQKPLDAGQNPPDGVIVSYFLTTKPDDEVRLSFADSAGNEITSFSSQADESAKNGAKNPTVPTQPGLNRFVWNIRYPDAVSVPGALFRSGGVAGPVAPPGRYSVTLAVGDQSFTQPFEIVKDPRVPATQSDFDAQFALLRQIQDKLSAVHAGVNQVREVRAQLDGWEKRSADRDDAVPIHEAAETLKKALTDVEMEMIEPRLKASKDPLHFPLKLNNQLAALASNVASADAAPTDSEREVFEVLSAKADKELATLKKLVEDDLARFNQLVENSSLPIVG
ncbi:MAG TPA: glycosyl hydrolase [Nitrolancea sp.]